MADEGKILLFKDDITGLIKENQTLLRKKGLLKNLLNSGTIRELLVTVRGLKESDTGIKLTENEKKLIILLEDKKWNLDAAIEKLIQNAADQLNTGGDPPVS